MSDYDNFSLFLFYLTMNPSNNTKSSSRLLLMYFFSPSNYTLIHTSSTLVFEGSSSTVLNLDVIKNTRVQFRMYNCTWTCQVFGVYEAILIYFLGILKLSINLFLNIYMLCWNFMFWHTICFEPIKFTSSWYLLQPQYTYTYLPFFFSFLSFLIGVKLENYFQLLPTTCLLRGSVHSTETD